MNIPSYFNGYLIGDLLSKTQTANIHKCTSIDQKQNLIKIALKEESNPLIFYYEFQLLKRFKSPNIIQSISNNQFDPHIFMLLEDQNLQQYWEFQNKKLDNAVVIDICLQIIDALIILHENKIVHTDVRIENIFIKDQTFKLSNFERNYYLDANQINTQGKNPGDAPEIINDQIITYKADIFSLGCLMFELLLGYKPFTQKQQQYDESCQNYLYAVEKEDLQINENTIEPKTYEIIKKMVKFRPEDRIDLKEVKKQLTQKEINVFGTIQGLKISDPNCWGQDAFVNVTATHSYTLEYFKTVFQKTKFFYEVSQSFGGKKYYNYQKTLFPRYMLLKKSYSILLYLKQLVFNQKPEFHIIIKEIEESIAQLYQILLQLKDYILKEQNIDYKTINNWKSELNLDETSQFKDYYKQAILFCIEYFEKSQLPYSKSKETPEQLKAFLIIYVNLKTCLIFNPFQSSSKIEKDLEKKEINELIQMSLIKL